MSKLWAIVGLVLVGWTFTSNARGQANQPWLEDRDEARGIGVRSGNVVWHPGAALEVGYDSNFFQGSGDPGEPAVRSMRLRLTPSLSLQSLGGERVEGDSPDAAPPQAKFKANTSLSFDRLFALQARYADLVNGQTYIGGNIDGQLNIAPGRPWGADLAAAYRRVVQPYNAPGVQSFNRNIYSGSADLRFRPGGGILQWNLGYGARLTTFDVVGAGLDNLAHGLRTRGVWRFLPRTGMLYVGELRQVARLDPNSRLPNALPISSQLGLNGLITPRLGALLLGGVKVIYFGADAAGNVEEFDDFVGRAELTWFITGQGEVSADEPSVGFSTLKLGYFRDGYPSELSNFYRIDKGYLDLTAYIGGVALVRLTGGLANVQHAVPRRDDGRPLATPAPREFRPEAQLYGEYRMTRTTALFVNSGFSASPVNNVVGTGMGFDSLKYTRFTALLGARWFL